MKNKKMKVNSRTFQDGTVIKFSVPDGAGMLRYRAETLMTKEPETIMWLDRMNKEDVLWDVGACIGSYSIYAAVRRGVNVCAFEPASYNNAVLETNIQLNNVSDKVISYPIAIGTEFAYTQLAHINDTDTGSSCNDIVTSGYSKASNYRNVSLTGCVVDSIDNLVEHGLPYPTHLKIDVDGAEPDVIKGAMKTLPNLKSILIELWPDPPKHLAHYHYRKQHKKVDKDLQSMGWVLDEELFELSVKENDESNGFPGQRNFIYYMGDKHNV